jgi:hypothetical protein
VLDNHDAHLYLLYRYLAQKLLAAPAGQSETQLSHIASGIVDMVQECERFSKLQAQPFMIVGES